MCHAWEFWDLSGGGLEEGGGYIGPGPSCGTTYLAVGVMARVLCGFFFFSSRASVGGLTGWGFLRDFGCGALLGDGYICMAWVGVSLK